MTAAIRRATVPRRRAGPLRQRDAWRLLTNIPFVLGTLGIVVIVLIAFFGPQVAPSDPHAQRSVLFYPDSSFAVPPTPPDQYNLLGTDPIGRDQLSRLLWGARLTLTIVLLGLVGRAGLALAFGLAAGWWRGTWVDHAAGYATNAVAGLPQLMLALLLAILLQGQGVVGFVLALGLVGWADLAQFVRSEVVRVAATPHLEAARSLGATGTHLLRVHILRDLAPQFIGLLALEAGSVLLLLAELGFIGFFIAGGIADTSISGAVILPVRDRAPEWGQMLAGARNYAFRDQYVAFVPGVVVVGAVLAFNLFAEGLRTATDPRSTRRLSPRTLGLIGRVLLAGVVISATFFGYVVINSRTVSYGSGLQSARDIAERVLPGSELLAGVVRLSSSAYGMSRPEKLSYYFRGEDSQILRVSFVGADENAADVKLHENEDELLVETLRPITSGTFVEWEAALRAAERSFGLAYRNESPAFFVRVVLAQHEAADAPAYRVQYGRIVGGTQVEVRVDAKTGVASRIPRRLSAAPSDCVTLGQFGRCTF